MPLTRDQASTVVSVTLSEGKHLGFAPLCAVVLDTGGHPLALLRDEGASISRPEIAIGKAAVCRGMGLGGREMARRAAAVPHFFASLAPIVPKGIVPVPGGVLIRNAEGILPGAVGVSGDPTADVTILQNRASLLAIMKGGVFNQPPKATLQ